MRTMKYDKLLENYKNECAVKKDNECFTETVCINKKIIKLDTLNKRRKLTTPLGNSLAFLIYVQLSEE